MLDSSKFPIVEWSGCSANKGSSDGTKLPKRRRRKDHGRNMISSIEIRNYRSFSSTKIEGCKRINLIVGDNGSGKTALLEGIFLAAGPSPEIALRTRAWRGIEGRQYVGTHEQVDRAIWADLFHKFDISKVAHIGLKGTAEHSRSVSLTFEPERRSFVMGGRRNRKPLLVIDPDHPVVFDWKGPKQFRKSFSPRVENGHLVFPDIESPLKSGFYAANRTFPAFEAVGQFSNLSKAFDAARFVDTFRKHFPRIKDLSIEVSAGQTMLFATIDGFPEKIPLSLTSGGMSKLAAMLLGFAAHPKGIVIFDEIENGIYYRRLPEIWRSIIAMAEAYDVQVFASTHSAECLKAAAEAAREHVDSFALHRTVMVGGETQVRSIKASKFVASMDEDIELR